jgi:hypothetical protein
VIRHAWGYAPGVRSSWRLRSHLALVAVCAGLVVLEAVLVSWLGPHGAVALAPQVTAPEPFGIVHDLRWLAVFHRSWATFAAEAGAFLVFRTGLVVLLVRLAWSGDERAPTLPTLLRVAGRFVITVAVLSAVWVTVMFALGVVSLGWLFFVGLPGFLVLALFTHHGVLRAWWREAPPVRTAAWVALSFVELSLAGAALMVVPAAVVPVVAVAAGLFNARAWLAIVGQLQAPTRSVGFRPVAPAAIALLVAASVLGVAVGAEKARSQSIPDAPRAGAAAESAVGRVDASGPAVVVATGFNSHWDGSPDAPFPAAAVQVRYSYAGEDAAGGPLPYRADATHRSIGALVRTMAAQVRHLHTRTGRRVALVAESEGSLVATAYLAAHPNAPIGSVVLLSPLLQPARVYYPPPGRQGWGVATGWVLRGVADLVDDVSSIDLSADSPLLRSVVDHAAVLRDALACVPRRVSSLVVLPITSGLGASDPAEIAARTLAVPAVHGGLLGNATARAAVDRVLAHRPVTPNRGWSATERAIRVLAAPWQVPVLPLSVNPVWSGRASGPACAATRHDARAWLG